MEVRNFVVVLLVVVGLGLIRVLDAPVPPVIVVVFLLLSSEQQLLFLPPLL